MGAHASFPFWLEVEDTSEVSYSHWIGHRRADTDVTYLGRGGTHTPASTWHGRDSDLMGCLGRWGHRERGGVFSWQAAKSLEASCLPEVWGQKGWGREQLEGRWPNALGLRWTATETLTEWPHPIQSQGEQLESRHFPSWHHSVHWTWPVSRRFSETRGKMPWKTNHPPQIKVLYI